MDMQTNGEVVHNSNSLLHAPGPLLVVADTMAAIKIMYTELSWDSIVSRYQNC